MNVKIKRIDKDFLLPEYQTKGSVGFDIYSRINAEIKPKELVLLPTNLIIKVPKGYMLMMVSRSSTFKKKGIILPNAAAIFDNDFCGEEDEMLIQAYNMSGRVAKIKKGERITQGIFVRVDLAKWEETDKMKSAKRGGIGSTDKDEKSRR